MNIISLCTLIKWGKKLFNTASVELSSKKRGADEELEERTGEEEVRKGGSKYEFRASTVSGKSEKSKILPKRLR